MLCCGMSRIHKKHIITLGGLPGSGKSTIKRMLAEHFGYTMFSTGDFVREMAADRNMTLEEFNELVLHDRSIDEHIDERLMQIEAHGDHYVIDSHLAYHFVPSGFSVFLHVTNETSAMRIFNDAQSPTRQKSGDVMSTLEEALERTQKRINNHTERYLQHYGINPYDETHYDLVINTELSEPPQSAEQIIGAYTTWLTT